MPSFKIAIQSNESSLAINGIQGLSKIAEQHTSLIPDIVSEGILDIILSKMMETDTKVYLAAH